MNKKRSFYNIAIGITSQVLSIVLGIIIPRMFIMSFGSEVNGFLNTISQIFTYLTLLEAGVGAATLQALYGPVGKKNKDDINGIMAATDRYYKRTGKIYFLAVVALAIIYPLVIKTEIPKITMILIIAFHGIPGVISYYFQGKFFLLLTAEGKSYINTAMTSIANTAVNFIKIGLMLAGCNILAVQFSYLVVNLLKVVFIGIYIKKKYKWLDFKVKPNYESISQKNAAFVNQICDLIFRNTDTIILSIFCDLKVVSVYAMYTMLFSMIRTALDYVAQGFSFVMGQTYNRDIEQYKKLHDLYETYRMALVFALYNIALIFILPFMKLYTAGITDINYIDYKVAVLFAVFYLMTGARACAADLIGYAQHFKLTQSRCIAEAAINLTVSIVGAYYLGIYGVLLGTIVALAYRMNDMIIYANHRILKRGTWVTYRKVLSNSILFAAITYFANRLPWTLDSYLTIILWAAVSGVIILGIYFVVGSLVNISSFKLFLVYAKSFVNGLMKKLKKQ